MQSEQKEEIYQYVQPFTMTSKERVFAMIESVEHIVKYNVEGPIVECGVWKGGSIIAALKTLQQLGLEDREFYLFDTFSGMTEPTKEDTDFACQKFKQHQKEHKPWAYSTLDEVKRNIERTQYRKHKVHYVVGKVEDTLPCDELQKIALLRLDTDWYASTKHEMIHLFPKLEHQGVLIIDDYGHWPGAKKAIDEYLNENKIDNELKIIDFTGRMMIKG
jgi:O-methyltransferase